MSEVDFVLPEIPDLSGIQDVRPEPFENGWYAGTILEKREFTDSNGNDRVFESNDTPAQNSGRNIRLQVELTRQSDNRKLNVSALINYQAEDFSADVVREIAARKAQGEKEWGPLFRSFMALSRLGALQAIAGVRQLSRTSDGGLDLTPLYGKTAYFRIRDDARNSQYKEIAEFQATKPKKIL